MRPFRFRYESRRLLAWILARVELHRLRTVNTADGKWLWKTRRWASGIAVRIGNGYLRLQRADVRVLPTDEWLRWELALWSKGGNTPSATNAVGRSLAQPVVCSNGLKFPRLPGEPLSQILAHSGGPVDTKLKCFGWALQSLEQLHTCDADWGDGCFQKISHGDATAENVIVDVLNRRASWIDFDTRHLVTLGSVERHADDLRALTFSAAVQFMESSYPQMAAQLRASYKHKEVLAYFRLCLCSRWERPNTFQLAQAPLPFHAARKLREVLAADLET